MLLLSFPSTPAVTLLVGGLVTICIKYSNSVMYSPTNMLLNAFLCQAQAPGDAGVKKTALFRKGSQAMGKAKVKTVKAYY